MGTSVVKTSTSTATSAADAEDVAAEALYRFKVSKPGPVPDELCSELYAKMGFPDRSKGHSAVIRALLGRGYSCSAIAKATNRLYQHVWNVKDQEETRRSVPATPPVPMLPAPVPQKGD